MSITIYDRFHRPVGVQLEFHDASLTEQHHKTDCDINNILDRYLKTGVLESRNSNPPLFGDISAAPQDYAAAVELLTAARERFASLPSKVRERFNNDPLSLLNFLDNPENRAEAASLGLLADSPASQAANGQGAPDASQNENNREAVTTGGGKEA